MKKPVKGKPVPKAKTHRTYKPPLPTRVHGGSFGPPPKTGLPTKVQGGSASPAKRAKQHPKAKKHPVRKLALGEGVACCSAEALAASLRLCGVAVSDEDVLALYWRTASDEDAGASILATLEAAAEFGLAGMSPSRARPFSMASEEFSASDGDTFAASLLLAGLPPGLRRGSGAAAFPAYGLILGVSEPAPHTVLATPDGWWSWGELYEPWTDDIDEAWEVTWPAIR